MPGNEKTRPLSAWRFLRRWQQSHRAVSDTPAVYVCCIVWNGGGRPYFVGYTDDLGQTVVRTTPVTTPRFALELRHEDITIFAVENLDPTVDHDRIEIKPETRGTARQVKDFYDPPVLITFL